MATTVHIVQPGVQQSGQPPLTAPPPQPPRNLAAIKGLAITQLVLGVLTVIFGIAAAARLYATNWTTNSGTGIWAGGWIIVTGIIGVCHFRNWQNTALNGVYMAFSIISTVASALAGLFFIIAVVFYSVLHGCYRKVGMDPYGYEQDCEVRSIGLGLHVPLLIMMSVEFFVSIVAAAFCCQNGCCNGTRVQGTVIFQQPGQMMMMQQTAYPQQYPVQAVPQYAVAPQYGAQLPQYSTQAIPPAYSQPGYPPLHQGQGHEAYMGKPPEYQPQ